MTSKYQILNIKASILHMIICCDKIYILVLKYLSLWSLPSLELELPGLFVFHKHILL